MSINLFKLTIRKWITLRMASQEFYSHEPFEIDKEYSIIKSILIFALFPIELIFIFTYARIWGSLAAYTIPLFLIMLVLNILISNTLVNKVKGAPFIDETISGYVNWDYNQRKRLYSFKNITSIILLTAGLPWLVSAIAIAAVCLMIPR